LRKTEVFRSSATIEVLARVGRTGFLTAVDGLQFMRSVHNEVADIVFIDPPFNLRKDYGIKSRLETAPPSHYEKYMQQLLVEADRVLKPGGALFFYHVPYWASRLSPFMQDRLKFRHWIAIAMKNGFVRGRNLYPAHYGLLYYTKGTPTHFRRPRQAPQTCRHCGGIVKDYGGYIDIINAKGVNLSDVWDDLSPVRHKSTKLRRANQLPLQLTNRVIDIAGKEDGILVDPFVGSGTSVVSCVAHGMKFVANDLSRRNVSLTVRRLRQLREMPIGD